MSPPTDLAVRPLHLLTDEQPQGIDLRAAESAAYDLLRALGADLADESLAGHAGSESRGCTPSC